LALFPSFSSFSSFFPVFCRSFFDSRLTNADFGGIIKLMEKSKLESPIINPDDYSIPKRYVLIERSKDGAKVWFDTDRYYSTGYIRIGEALYEYDPELTDCLMAVLDGIIIEESDSAPEGGCVAEQ
jgi:hypothetical protein